MGPFGYDESVGKAKEAFMCAVDWEHELESIDCTVHSYLDSALERRPCLKECGVYRVEIKVVEYLKPPFESQNDGC